MFVVMMVMVPMMVMAVCGKGAGANGGECNRNDQGQ